MKKSFIVLLAALLLAACGGTAEPRVITENVEVTRIVEVEVPVEVTRIVEVETEVTRVVEVEVEVTPRPTQTPRPTATSEAPILGTRQNPVPLGEVMPMSSGDILFDISVADMVRGPAALQMIKAANQFNEDPPDGLEFVVLLLDVAYTGADEGILELSPYVTSIVTNGQVIAYDDTFVYAPCCIEPPFEVSLLSGGSGQGWLALPVAVDDAAPMLLLGNVDGGVYFSLAGEGEG